MFQPPIREWCRTALNAESMRDLRQAYRTPGRWYHTWAHVQSVWNHLDKVPPSEHMQAMRLAVLYHNAVYSTAPDEYIFNEERSAIMLLNHAGSLPEVDDEQCSEQWAARYLWQCTKKEAPLAAAIVRATKTHALDTIWEGEEYTASMRQACEWVLDADIAILGSNERDLEVYDDGIAKEWGYGKKNPEHDAAFAKKRVQVLRAMQTNKTIYRSKEFSNLEQPAVLNIERLILKWDARSSSKTR